ncbi:YihY/virulence factor BrkB family protein [Chloroflexota bacterium]
MNRYLYMRYIHSFVQALAGGSKRVFRYLQLAIGEFLDDNGSHLSAAMSYYILLSLVPVLLALMSILGFLLPSYPGIGDTVREWFYNFLPLERTREVIDLAVEKIVDIRQISGVLAIIAMLWSGTAIFNVIRKTLNIIWGITIPRPFFRERLMEVVMVAVVGSVMLASFWLTFAISLVGDLTSLQGFARTISEGVLGYFLPSFIMFLVFVFLYRFTPYVKLRWKDVWIEALIAAVVFEVLKNLFVWYLQRFQVDNFLGSTLGAIFATLVWAYVSSVAFLFCAEMSSLRYRGVTLWGRGKVETTEGPIPSFLESRIEPIEDQEAGDGDQEVKLD